MERMKLAAAALLGLALTAPVDADVTLKQKVDTKAMGRSMSGEGVQYIKGTKMRMDQIIGNDKVSTILDAGTGQMIVLNHGKREADVYDMTKLTSEMSKLPVGEITTTLTPTSQTRQIAGVTCTVHDMKAVVPMDMGGNKMEIVLEGPTCLAQGAPGEADLKAFYTAVAEKGFFFADPRQAKAQPGHARGMTQLYREMAARGLPLSQELNMSFKGSGPMAGMMNKMGGTVSTTEVTAISTDPIPDSMFEVPDGYKVKNR